MHEVEHMIRLVLVPGPQRGADVLQWVMGASHYSRRKVLQVAATMEGNGELHRGLWSLHKGAQDQLYQTLESRLPGNSPPSIEELPEVIEREWRELRGEM